MTQPSGERKKKKSKTGTKKTVSRKAIPEKNNTSFLFQWAPFVILTITALIVLQARLHLLAIPLERDEAGFAYIGHWMLKGKSLYIDMVDNKLPGLYLMYGMFTNLFGYNATGVHIGLLLANVASAVCFYLLVRDLFNRFTAALATAFFLLLVTGINVVGFAAHATQLLLPFVLGGWLLFWKGISSGRLYLFFLAGFLLGFAFIVKQQSIVFGMMAAILWWPLRLWWNKSNSSVRISLMEWVLLGVGGLLPVGMAIAYFSATGRWDELIFWTYFQPAALASSFSTSRWGLFQIFFPLVIKDFIPLWVTAFSGLVLVWIAGYKKSAAIFVTSLALLGLASVAIGAAFYQHYFILAMPGIALLAAVTLDAIKNKWSKVGVMISLMLALILIVIPVLAQREYFFKPDYIKIHQEVYNQNMFPELERIGQELGNRVSPNGKIAILGSEPGVLVSANRAGCSKHLYMYPLLSDPKNSPAMQEEFKKEIMECMPEYIVWSTNTGSWAPGYDKLQMINQLMEWVNGNYATIGLAELRPGQPGVIVWDQALQSHQSQSQFKIYVFRKNEVQPIGE